MTTKKIFMVILLPLILLIGCKSEKENMLEQGDELFMRGKVQEASGIYSQLIHEYPDNLIPYIRYANCFFFTSKNNYYAFKSSLKEAGKADKTFEKLIQNGVVDETNPGMRLTQEERKQRILEYSNEIEFFTRAINKNPGDYRYFLGRGAWYLLIDEPKLAKMDFDEAVKINPNSLDALLMRARYFDTYIPRDSRNGFYGYWRDRFTSMRYFAEALEKFPDNESLLRETAMNYNMYGYPSFGKKILAEAYEKDNSKYHLLYELAILNLETEDYREAVKYLEILCMKSPNNGLAFYNLGTTQIRIGERKKGIENLKKALVLNRGLEDVESDIEKILAINSEK